MLISGSYPRQGVSAMPLKESPASRLSVQRNDEWSKLSLLKGSRALGFVANDSMFLLFL